MKPLLALLFLPSLAFAGDVMESSHSLPDGSRVLQHQVLVAATPEQAYAAWTMAGAEILSYVPNEMISFRVPESAKVFAVVQFGRIEDPKTARIRFSVLPFAKDDEALYESCRIANARLLQRFEARFRSGSAGEDTRAPKQQP